MENIQKTRFDRADWIQLFLVCGFPIQFWALFSSLRDFTWLIGQVGLWDGIGFLSYVLIYAFIDTFLLFFIVATVSFLTPKSWQIEYRFTWLAWLGFSIAILSLVDQILVSNIYVRWVEGFLDWLPFPVWSLLEFSLGIIILTIIFPQITLKKNFKILDGLYSFLDKVATLSIFYIILDGFGFVVVLIRTAN